MWDQQGMSCCSVNFHPLAFLASLDIGGNFRMHVRPPEVPLDSFLSSIRSRVSCYHCVMMLSDDLSAEGSVCRNIDQAISEDKTISGGEPFWRFSL